MITDSLGRYLETIKSDRAGLKKRTKQKFYDRNTVTKLRTE